MTGHPALFMKKKKEMFQNINGCMPLQRSEDCYVFRQWSPETSPKHVDLVGVVYVLTTTPVDGMSQRLRDALHHLSTVSLSKTVMIVFNRTFKTCQKPELCHSSTIYDLDDANRHIAQHAQAHFPGEVICIMEDDFMWTDVSTVVHHLEHIRDFVEANVQDMDHYSLGSLTMPFATYPYTWNLRHWRIRKGGGTQSMLHTPRGLDKIVSRPRCAMEELDMGIGIDGLYFQEDVTYMYFWPLSVQRITETDNQREWSKTVLGQMGVWHAHLWKMHHDPRPGTYCVYIMCLILPVLVAVVVFLAVLLSISWKPRQR